MGPPAGAQLPWRSRNRCGRFWVGTHTNGFVIFLCARLKQHCLISAALLFNPHLSFSSFSHLFIAEAPHEPGPGGGFFLLKGVFPH